MLKLLTNSENYLDRFCLNIHLNEFEYSNMCGHFIMSPEAVFRSDCTSVNGAFAAYTNSKFEIFGKSVVIKMPGINFSGTTIRTIENFTHGELSYIDGCSNTGLIPPGRNGEPCINYLHFPKNITQTPHTHPSIRIGYVLDGAGTAHTATGKIELTEDSVFLLDRHTLHNFSTSNSTMSLMVFHPDSDSGPTDEFNPMKTRTYIQK